MKYPDTTYTCPHCKTKKEPRKRYTEYKEIFICENCTHEFQKHELHAKQHCDIYDYRAEQLKEAFIKKEITIQEFEKYTMMLLRDPFCVLY